MIEVPAVIFVSYDMPLNLGILPPSFFGLLYGWLSLLIAFHSR